LDVMAGVAACAGAVAAPVPPAPAVTDLPQPEQNPAPSGSEAPQFGQNAIISPLRVPGTRQGETSADPGREIKPSLIRQRTHNTPWLGFKQALAGRRSLQ
jgi:hypothetical protein